MRLRKFQAIMDAMASLHDLADLATPWCIHVAATLGIADHIAAGTTSVEDLAAKTSSDPQALGAVLRHLVSRGVFEEDEINRFTLNEIAEELLAPSTRRFLALDGVGGRFAQAWSTLPTVVRTGEPAYKDLFGRTFWEDLDAHPHLAEDFDALMGVEGHGVPDPNVLPSGDWEGIETVVDVGGGTGGLLAEILRARPGLRGILVDLPKTVGRSPEVFEKAGVTDRAQAIAQSFFDPLPANADLYILKSVLNDWPDGETRQILANVAKAAKPASRIVVIGGITPDERSSTLSPEFVLCGGKTQSLAKFEPLAKSAGLQIRAFGILPSRRFAVELAGT